MLHQNWCQILACIKILKEVCEVKYVSESKGKKVANKNVLKKVDLEYPKKLHDIPNDHPLVLEKIQI